MTPLPAIMHACATRDGERVGRPSMIYGEGRPITEVVVVDVRRGTGDAYIEAFRQASRLLRDVPGYIRHDLRRCVERPDRFLFTIEWASIEAHTVGFRTSPQYQEWKRLLHHFYEPFPAVEHYETIATVPSS